MAAVEKDNIRADALKRADIPESIITLAFRFR
jgi:hypothetical protein